MKKSDYTRGANLIGPATALLEQEVKRSGILTIEREGRPDQEVMLPRFFGGRRLAVIAQPGLTVLFDAESKLENPGLMGLILEGKQRSDCLFFWPDQLTGRIRSGEDGGSGAWTATINGSKRAPNPQLVEEPLPFLRGRFLRILIDSHPDSLGFHFLVNLQNRPFFSNDFLDRVRHPNQMNRLELWFVPKTGEFIRSKLIGQDKETLQLIQELDIPDFPLRWPSQPRERVKVFTAPKAKIKVERPAGSAGGGYQAEGRLGKNGQRGFTPPPRMNSTTQLAIKEMIAELEKTEVVDSGDPWPEIENNLELLDPQRAFNLVGKFPELIGEKTADWPRYKLREVFGELPGPSLTLLFNSWPLDHSIALAHDHPDRAALIDYLRDFEVERLMSRRENREPGNKAAARELLGVGLQASTTDVKRAWRMLLGWMNADFGRHNERAIHQKKDEIAKNLNRARDILIK